MVSLSQLWLPILLSAIACHIIGFLVWVILPHHRSDYSTVPDEAAVQTLLKGKVQPGQYVIPHSSQKEWGTPEMVAKRNEGPNAFLVVVPNGMGNMAAQQVKNVLFHATVSLFVAYLAAHALGAGAAYLQVFQVTGTAAFLAYGFTWGHQVIWFGRPFKVGMKDMLDGLVMALVTAGIFGWRWPGSM